jgi:uncharacterized protein
LTKTCPTACSNLCAEKTFHDRANVMPNRLAAAQSLYLRKHADNPIDWWPWSSEALETAQHENKPIFLSVGYSSCHWCTVMEGEAFSNLEIAAYLNANFLPIKVDREERPDLDSIYMAALQAMTSQGGWPMNLFLTPDDLVPFYGGTYFPIEPRYGRPSFLDVLYGVRRFYDSEKEQLDQQTQKLMGFLHSTTALIAGETLDPELLERGFQICTAILNRPSSGPSFPMMPYAMLVLGDHSQSSTLAEEPAPALQQGLDVALGGIYDHVAGGFHRYTVDATWTVPHFEKMLYDNGQMVEYLANLWSAGNPEPAFERAIALTAQWLKREMTAPQGYFYAAQDADNFVKPTDLEPEEGRFYVWGYGELEALLASDEWDALRSDFDIQPEGNFEQGHIVLQRRQSGVLSEITEQAIAKLFQVRYGSRSENLATFAPAYDNAVAKQTQWPGRIPPVTDTKMIVSWNGLMISGLARAAAVFSNLSYLRQAIQAAQFILDHQWKEERLHRIHYEGEVAIPAQSEDYAFLIKALIDLHQASLALEQTDAQKWLTAALNVQQEFDRTLWAVDGGYYSSADVADDLILRERSWMDNATPSANGVAIANLVRLAFLSDTLTLLDQAEQALKTFTNVLKSSPAGCPSLFAALDWYSRPTLVRTSSQQIGLLMPKFYGPTALFLIDEDLPGSVPGLVCEGTFCLPPARTQEAFVTQIQTSQARKPRC